GSWEVAVDDAPTTSRALTRTIACRTIDPPYMGLCPHPGSVGPYFWGILRDNALVGKPPRMTNQPAVRVAAIRKAYGDTVAVDNLSFDVQPGEIFGLIGPNGAGKTTAMECVEGLRRPDRGTITVLGLDPRRDIYRLQQRVGVQLQEAQLQ